MDFRKLLEAMQSGEVNTQSQLKLRDENVQVRGAKGKIKRLKKDKNLKCKLLVPMDFACPFDPFLGKVTEKYNDDNKFRPDLSFSSTVKTLKNYFVGTDLPEDIKPEEKALEMEIRSEAKKVFMSKAGLKEWDIKDPNIIDEVDKVIFYPYRHKKYFSVQVCTVNIPEFTGQTFPVSYIVNVKRDPLSDEIIGEKSVATMASEYFTAIAFEKIAELEKKIANKEEDLKDDDKKEKIRGFFNESPISSDFYMNHIIGYEIPLDSKFNFDKKFNKDSFTEDTVKNYRVLTKVPASLTNTMKLYDDGSYEKFDKNPDFIEIEIAVGDEEDDMLRGKNTKFEKPSGTMDEHPDCKEICDTITADLDSWNDIETQFRKSCGYKTLDESSDMLLLDYLKSTIDLDNKYVTANIIKSHTNFLNLVFGEEFDDVICKVASGEVEEGTERTKEEIKETRKYSIQSVLDSAEEELDDSEELE